MLTKDIKNAVCVSNLLTIYCPELYKQLVAILRQVRVECHTIKYNADYWCRDYMPVQRQDERFVQFVIIPITCKTKEAT